MVMSAFGGLDGIVEYAFFVWIDSDLIVFDCSEVGEESYSFGIRTCWNIKRGQYCLALQERWKSNMATTDLWQRLDTLEHLLELDSSTSVNKYIYKIQRNKHWTTHHRSAQTKLYQKILKVKSLGKLGKTRLVNIIDFPTMSGNMDLKSKLPRISINTHQKLEQATPQGTVSPSLFRALERIENGTTHFIQSHSNCE